MLKNVLSKLWHASPRILRRIFSRLAHERFTVTAGVVVRNERNEVLLFKHVFRPGSGWGIPGGFMERGEQPEEAVRREVREEVGIELEEIELAFVRTLPVTRQIEIVFRSRTDKTPKPCSIEIEQAVWFALDHLPPELPDDQHYLIRRALQDGAMRQN